MAQFDEPTGAARIVAILTVAEARFVGVDGDERHDVAHAITWMLSTSSM